MFCAIGCGQKMNLLIAGLWPTVLHTEREAELTFRNER